MAHPVDGICDWWNSDSKKVFVDLYDELVSRGFSETRAVILLSRAYNATAQEYGD